MGVDCRGDANFRTYPFVENAPFWHLDLACMKFPSTVKPIGVDCRGNPNFRIYPFVENALLWILDLACMEFHATVQPVQTFAPTLFLKTMLSALLGTLPSPLQPETDFCSTFHTTTELGPGD